MSQANSTNTTVPEASVTRRLALGIFAGAAAAIPAAGALASQTGSSVDPIFELVEAHRSARASLTEAEQAHALVERELMDSGDLFPSVVSVGNPHSGLSTLTISRTHREIDSYTPADLYPERNRQEHAELDGKIARHNARHPQSEAKMTAAWREAQSIFDELVSTPPTTLAGVMAILAYQREFEKFDCEPSVEAWHFASICDSIETALQSLNARGVNHVTG